MDARIIRIFRTATVCLAAWAGLLLAADAQAVSILWTVSGNFDDGGRVDGTFIYDVDLDVYSEISLKTQAGSRGSPFFGAMYDSVDTDASDSAALSANTIMTLLELAFSPALPDHTGSVILSSGSETLTSGADAGAIRQLTTGRATGVPAPPPMVPEPSTGVLLALGLTGLATARRFRG